MTHICLIGGERVKFTLRFGIQDHVAMEKRKLECN